MDPLKSLVEYRGPITLAARLRTRNREEGKTRTRQNLGWCSPLQSLRRLSQELKSQSNTLSQNTREIKIQNEISNKKIEKEALKKQGLRAYGHNGA